MKPKEEIVEEDGKLHFKRSIEVDTLIEGVAERMERESHNTREGVVGARYMGSIDEITALNWAKECGARMYSKEWLAHAKKKIASGDYAVFFPKRSRKRYV